MKYLHIKNNIMYKTKLIVASDFNTETLQEDINNFLSKMGDDMHYLDLKIDITQSWACVIYNDVSNK